jgi:thioredoxin 2
MHATTESHADHVHVVCAQCGSRNRVVRARVAERPKCGACKQPLFSAHPVALDDRTFERHLTGNDLPLVVDFWAPWCGPCLSMAPQFERATADLEPAYRVAKLDTEAAPATAARYSVRSIPTLILFHRGREIARQAGAVDATALVRWVRANTPR